MALTSPSNQQPGTTNRCARITRRALAALAFACLSTGLVGCENTAKNLGDYFNLRNSFLTPSEVGRFDKANPWGSVRPIKWPILEQLDVIDAPANEWDAATDPTPADIVADTKEFAIGAGDLVRVSIYDLAQPGQEYLKEATVSETGTVDILYLGSVQISGLTPTQANEKIGQVAIERHAILPAGNGSPGPQVSVTVLQSRGRVFSIIGLGNVSRPGTYNILSSNFRVLDALALAGDIQVQPGLDYLYVIRSTASDTTPAAPAGVTPTSPGASVTPPGTTGNPLDAIDSIEKNTTKPSVTPPASAPSPMGPGSMGPRYVGPLPTAVVMTSGSHSVSQADMDAALSGTRAIDAPATATGPATKPGDLMDQALDSTAPKSQMINVGGKWVPVQPKNDSTKTDTGTVAATNPTNPVSPADTGSAIAPVTPAPANPHPAGTAADYAAAERLSGQRVIKIPIAALRSGDPRYNIIIRPGDVINVPPIETGEFYMAGHVARPGVFALTGRKITLKMAVAAAGGLDALAIPRRCDLIRRIGTNQEATVMVNLQAIFDGTQPDIFLKPNDVVNVGTDAISPFLAVTRNAYRLSYGLGFVYDRNFYIQPQGAVQGQ